MGTCVSPLVRPIARRALGRPCAAAAATTAAVLVDSDARRTRACDLEQGVLGGGTLS